MIKKKLVNTSIKNISLRTLLYLVLSVVLIATLLPIYLMILSSFKSLKDIYSSPFGIPSKLILANYIKVFDSTPFVLFFRNSLIVTIASLFLTLLFSAMVAYILSKYRFPGNRLVYFFFLAGIMIPIRLGTITLVQIFNKISLVDNLLSLIIIYVVINVPFGIFILYGFMRMIPNEILNAARIDGASEYAIFFRIIVPLSVPGLAAVTVISILPIWNDFWFPLVLVKKESFRVLSLGASMLFGRYGTDWGVAFSTLTLASLPLIILYLVFSKQFQRGFAEGILKD
jgi:raffinose/stachyose/melibiose transport system permease protein